MKKLSLTIAAGVAALGVSSFAFAAGGYAPPAPKPAWHPNFYVGVEGGWADLHYANSSTLDLGSPGIVPIGPFVPLEGPLVVKYNKNDWGVRPYVGYEWTPYFATELGYTYYGSPTVKVFSGSTELGKASFTQQAVDVVAKVMYPIDNFTPYAKAGVAWVHRGNAKVTVAGTTVDLSGSDNKAALILGAGVGYNITPKINVHVGYSHTFKTGDLPQIDFVTGGISYHFMNV